MAAPWNFLSLDQVIRIAALGPNNLYDRDQSDNYTCDTAHIVLGIPDPGPDRTGVLIPNPFAGTLDMSFVTPSLEPLGATLFAATDEQLATTTIPAASPRFRWDLPGLSAGLHILRLEGRSTSTTHRLVHQRP